MTDNVGELWGWCATDAMRRMRYWLSTHSEHLRSFDPGSAAYSWEIGDLHFIQLHNSPTYEVPETQICASLAWLKADLKDAFERGKRIALFMHKPISSSMKAHLKGYQYNLVGIFYGHHHEDAGYTGDFTVEGVPIPRFYGGSVQWNLFTLAHFEADRLTVTVIDSHSGQAVHHDDVESYGDLGSVFIAAPHTHIYPTHDCPVGQIPSGEDGACAAPALEAPPVELCY